MAKDILLSIHIYGVVCERYYGARRNYLKIARGEIREENGEKIPGNKKAGENIEHLYSRNLVFNIDEQGIGL